MWLLGGVGRVESGVESWGPLFEGMERRSGEVGRHGTRASVIWHRGIKIGHRGAGVSGTIALKIFFSRRAPRQ